MTDNVVTMKPARRRLTIRTGAELHRVVNEAEQALARDENLYTRGDSIVRILARDDGGRARVQREPGMPAIHTLTKPSMRDALSAVADWQRFDKRSQDWTACAPPPDVADTLLSRSSWPSLRPLAGIATAAILRPDGTIAHRAGYDAPTQYVLALDAPVRVPSAPTREDAFAARDRVLALVADFPFRAEADRAAWLALALTLACRASILGPVPLFPVTANVRGSGKSKLVDIPAIIATGRSAARATQPTDEAETGKVLTSIAIEADALVLFDNIDRPLGGGKLDAWLTGDRWSDRVLGSNARIDLPIVTVVAATGNNLELRGDTLRRALPIRLESDHERPETRTDFRVAGDLLAHVREHREQLAVDLVTMGAAWFAAGQPVDPSVPRWGSFEAWSALIPQICRWLDLPDPMTTRVGLEEDDPETMALRTLVTGWKPVEMLAGTHGLTAREFVERVYSDGRPKDGHEDVAAALEVLAPGRGRERVDVTRLGYVLRSAKRRKVAGKRIDHAAKNAEGILRWTVR